MGPTQPMSLVQLSNDILSKSACFRIGFQGLHFSQEEAVWEIHPGKTEGVICDAEWNTGTQSGYETTGE